MKSILTLTLSLFLFVANGQNKKTAVLTLGTFHFAFHNLDIKKVDKKNQIDILEPKYQKEIEDIVKDISKYKPTIIAIEREPRLQSKIDSIYDKYLKGEHKLSREEYEQIGFRIAKLFGHKKLYCVDDGGDQYEYVNQFFESNDSIEKRNFMDYFEHNPDSLKFYYQGPIFATKGILAELRQLNDEKEIKRGLGNYLIGIFKYETKEKEYFGPDFTTGWWFNRNLRIFRNIQRINANPSDRILIIFGAGHMNILNTLFDCSPEFELLKTNDYLE